MLIFIYLNNNLDLGLKTQQKKRRESLKWSKLTITDATHNYFFASTIILIFLFLLQTPTLNRHCFSLSLSLSLTQCHCYDTIFFLFPPFSNHPFTLRSVLSSHNHPQMQTLIPSVSCIRGFLS